MEWNGTHSILSFKKMEKEHGGAHTAQDSNLAPDRQTVSVGNPGHVAQRRRHHQRGQFPHTSPRHAPAPRPLPSPRSTFSLLLRCYDERESADASTFSAAPVAGAGGGTAARHVATPRFRSHVPVPIGLDWIGRGRVAVEEVLLGRGTSTPAVIPRPDTCRTLVFVRVPPDKAICL